MVVADGWSTLLQSIFPSFRPSITPFLLSFIIIIIITTTTIATLHLYLHLSTNKSELLSARSKSAIKRNERRGRIDPLLSLSLVIPPVYYPSPPSPFVSPSSSSTTRTTKLCELVITNKQNTGNEAE
jgi:hypothetical protein